MAGFFPLDPNRLDIFVDVVTGEFHGYHWEQPNQHEALATNYINDLLRSNYPTAVFMSERVSVGTQGYRMVPTAIPSYLTLQSIFYATPGPPIMPDLAPLGSSLSQNGPLASSSTSNIAVSSSAKTPKKKTSRRAGGKMAIVGAPATQRPRRGQRTAPGDKDPLEWPHVCNVCQQRTKTLHDMARHFQKKGHTEKSFPCSAYGCTCGKVFTREDAVKRHARGRGLIA